MALRIILATIVLAGCWAAAIWVGGYTEHELVNIQDNIIEVTVDPAWSDPAAVALAIVGVGAAAAILVARRRRA